MKLILLNCTLFNHCKVWKQTQRFPNIYEKNKWKAHSFHRSKRYFVITQTHIDTCVVPLSRKETSISYLTLPRCGLCYRARAGHDQRVALLLVSCFEVDEWPSNHLLKGRCAMSTTLAHISFSSFHSLRFQCFHKHQNMSTICWAYSCVNVFNK